MIVGIPSEEAKELDKFIKSYRSEYIRSPQEIVEQAFLNHQTFVTQISKRQISDAIAELRTMVWNIYLEDEVKFNIALMQNLHQVLDTPKRILDCLLNKDFSNLDKGKLHKTVVDICGEYAGRVYPYIYKIALSNTNSRRSRAGISFEAIIYKIYDSLNYPFDSQRKVGITSFAKLGLGKKVDSILPDIKAYEKRRNKTIVGTMKTSLRERWQEVAEEIERTKIPVIHLLTADENISLSKAKEMNNHNIIIVAYDKVSNSKQLKPMKNIISFEEYLFDEIPAILKFWKNE